MSAYGKTFSIIRGVTAGEAPSLQQKHVQRIVYEQLYVICMPQHSPYTNTKKNN